MALHIYVLSHLQRHNTDYNIQKDFTDRRISNKHIDIPFNSFFQKFTHTYL